MSQENEDWRYDDDFIKTTKITTWKLYFLTLNQLVNCFLKIELKPRYFRTKLYAINISLFLRRRKDSFSYDKCAFLSVDFIQFYLQFVRLYVFVFECRGEKKRQNEQKKWSIQNISTPMPLFTHSSILRIIHLRTIYRFQYHCEWVIKYRKLERWWAKMYVYLCTKQKCQHPNEIARKKNQIE